MKKLILVTLTLVALLSTLKSQNLYKVGVSTVISYDSWHEKVNTAYGIDGAVEFGIGERFSFNLGGAIHYGSNKNGWEENALVGKNQLDFLAGIESDFRYHFKKRYEGFYLGLGGEHKFYQSKYYFPVTESDPVPTFQGFEHSFGVALGTYLKVGNLKLNPNFYIGGSPFGVDYPVKAKVGLILSSDKMLFR